MKKRINLFSVKYERLKRERRHRKIRMLATAVGIVFFIIFILIGYLQFREQKQVQSLNQEKQKYLNFLLENKNDEVKLRVFKAKQSQLDRFLKDDASFLPYYQVLKDAIYSSTRSAEVDSIVIDKNRNTEFEVSFGSNPEMISFLNYIETEKFLNNFSNLVLTSFNLIEDEKQGMKKSYKLVFMGRFNEINGKKTD